MLCIPSTTVHSIFDSISKRILLPKGLVLPETLWNPLAQSKMSKQWLRSQLSALRHYWKHGG